MKTMRVTVKELAEMTGVDGVTVNSFLRFMELKGVAKIVDHRKSSAGRGRSSSVYEIPEKIGNLDLTTKVEKVEKVGVPAVESVESVEV